MISKTQEGVHRPIIDFWSKLKKFKRGRGIGTLNFCSQKGKLISYRPPIKKLRVLGKTFFLMTHLSFTLTQIWTFKITPKSQFLLEESPTKIWTIGGFKKSYTHGFRFKSSQNFFEGSSICFIKHIKMCWRRFDLFELLDSLISPYQIQIRQIPRLRSLFSKKEIWLWFQILSSTVSIERDDWKDGYPSIEKEIKLWEY